MRGPGGESAGSTTCDLPTNINTTYSLFFSKDFYLYFTFSFFLLLFSFLRPYFLCNNFANNAADLGLLLPCAFGITRRFYPTESFQQLLKKSIVGILRGFHYHSNFVLVLSVSLVSTSYPCCCFSEFTFSKLRPTHDRTSKTFLRIFIDPTQEMPMKQFSKC